MSTQWIESKDGVLHNLAQAFETNYDSSKEQLTVWWAFPLPANNGENQTVAEHFGSERLEYLSVAPHEWQRFKGKMLAWS